MEKLEKKHRNLTADFLKGVMIFCVMYGHAISKINSLRGVTWQDSVVNVFVTSFEMPLFIMISGYFLWFSLRKKPHFTVFWQRVISVALPLLVWEGIPAVYSFISETVNNGFSIINVAKIAARLVFPGLWFLACYLICSSFVIIIEWVSSKVKERKNQIALGTAMYAGLIVGLHFVKPYFDYVPFMFPFFLVGFILSKYSILNKKGVRGMIAGLAVLFVVLYPFYEPEHSFYVLDTYIAEYPLERLPTYIYRFVLGLSGCSLFYLLADYLCKRAEKNRAVLFITKIGTRTMELYILSMAVQDILIMIVGRMIPDTSVINNLTAPLLFGPVFLVVMTWICLMIDSLVQKSPKIHKIIFGR